MMPNKESIKEAQNLILFVSGGIGRNIQATAVCRAIKKAYPEKDLLVLAGYPDIFLMNPHIRRAIPQSQSSYFFEDYINNPKNKSVFINAEPYQHYDYIYRKKHFVEAWCDMIGVPCDGINPEIHFKESELRMAELFLEKFDRDMVLFQHQGGKVPKDKSEKELIASKSGMYKRSLPEKVVDEVTDGLIARGFMVGSVGAETQHHPTSAEKIIHPLRAILALIPYVAEVISIDSFLMHGAAAFGKKTLALWGGTNPKSLGYDSNFNKVNIACETPMCHRPNSYMFDFEPTGFLWDCPQDDACMNTFKAQDILQAFDEMTGGRKGEQRTKFSKQIHIEPKPCNAKRVLNHSTGKINEEVAGVEASGDGIGKDVSADARADCPCK